MEDTVKLFKEITGYVMEELGDAEKYIKKAMCYKTTQPELAQMFYQLSTEEMGHYSMELAQLQKMASPMSADGNPEMQLAYEVISEHSMDWERSIKMMQQMFRE